MGDEDAEELFVEKYTDEDLLEFIEHEEVVTTREVADHFDYHLQTVRRRLRNLEHKGELRMKDVGKRLVWWIPRENIS